MKAIGEQPLCSVAPAIANMIEDAIGVRLTDPHSRPSAYIERSGPPRPSPTMPKLSNEDAAQLLFKEAHLIDTEQLGEWLALFTTDGIYWLPIDEESGPTMEPSMLYDGPLLREQRVHQILHEPHFSQVPRSRTVHQRRGVG